MMGEEAAGDGFSEWGPSINGYRFVGKTTDQKYYKQRHHLAYSKDVTGQDGYNWSYLDDPQCGSEDEGGVDGDSAGVNDNDDDINNSNAYSYNDYCLDWQSIKSTGSNVLVFPIRSVGDALTEPNVEAFLRTASDYGKALKMERIRWHPDKMVNALRLKGGVEAELLKSKITTTFQIINKLYESNSK